MSSLRNLAVKILERMKNSPPEVTAAEVADTYPHISLEDAKRIQDGITDALGARSLEDRRRVLREYTALHAELRKKYRKSGNS